VLFPSYDAWSAFYLRFAISLYAQVLRSYDSRVRPTDRSSEFYLDEPCCESIVGEKAKIVLEINKDVMTDDDDNNVCDELFSYSSADRGKLLIIAIPYKEGQHVARKPTDFIPVMEQLQTLHRFGYAHGDIRAFNVVFCGDGKGAFLIDFDFSGKPENSKAYPRGYQQHLSDGFRIGKENSRLAFWHDWYALGQLIFNIFVLIPPSVDQNDDLVVLKAKLSDKWVFLPNQPTEDEIMELESLLVELAKQNWTVKPRPAFQDQLDEIFSETKNKTQIGATGSPPR
jgi:serine/threonine protein kinase